MIKINIFFEFKNGPWGGGNQFLKSLRNYLSSTNAYEEDPVKAQVILFNSHQYLSELARFKLKYADKVFVHRIDGPMCLYNKMSDKRDDLVFAANKYLADATVFQSDWSREQNHILGLPAKRFEAVISNAPDPAIFNREGKIAFSIERKVRLIATSWSTNWKKGFGVYQWLDKSLDFNKYEMTFVGRSPVQFGHIYHILPLENTKLAEHLKKGDIFIIASEKDPCSNSLIEALHCGLPAVVLRDGGHPQILGAAGETFTVSDEIPHLLDKIISNYRQYQRNISVPTMEQIGGQYFNFVEHVYQQIHSSAVKLKRPDYIKAMAVFTIGNFPGTLREVTDKIVGASTKFVRYVRNKRNVNMKQIFLRVLKKLFSLHQSLEQSPEQLMYRVHLFDELLLLVANKDKFRGKRILEIGPKDGLDSVRLASLNPNELVMIDLPEKHKGNIKWLSKVKCPHKYIEENFMYMSQQEYNTLGSFDLIWCTGILYHNPEQMRFLRKLYKLLSVGGYLVLESATLCVARLLKKGCYVEIHYPETYRNTGTVTHLPTANAIKAWLKMVGFREIHDSSCYDKENKKLKGVRYACICRKNDNDEADLYYAKSGLNPQYRFGDST